MTDHVHLDGQRLPRERAIALLQGSGSSSDAGLARLLGQVSFARRRTEDTWETPGGRIAIRDGERPVYRKKKKPRERPASSPVTAPPYPVMTPQLESLLQAACGGEGADVARVAVLDHLEEMGLGELTGRMRTWRHPRHGQLLTGSEVAGITRSHLKALAMHHHLAGVDPEQLPDQEYSYERASARAGRLKALIKSLGIPHIKVTGSDREGVRLSFPRLADHELDWREGSGHLYQMEGDTHNKLGDIARKAGVPFAAVRSNLL